MSCCGCTAELRALELATENVELRQQLAESQDQCVELAVDAGELHAEIEALRARLHVVERDRDRWRAQVEQPGRAAVA